MPRTILAFDYGQKRIGIAVGQDITGSASPLGIVDNDHGRIDFDRIDQLIKEWQPERLVVGMPFHADGSDSDLQAPVKAFINKLGRYELPIETTDERYTSVEAERELKAARAEGRRGRVDKAAIDAAAAVLIAERYLSAGS